MTPDADAVAALLAEIRVCRICVEQPRGAPLPHEPRPALALSVEARILIASQAPGARVHESGVPFDDRSGDRLRHWLGVGREQFYNQRNFAILPMGFCFPGQDRHGGDLPPRRECAPAWRDRALAAVPSISLILAIGRYAQSWHVPALRGASVDEAVRRWREIFAASANPRVLPLPHPSWRNTHWLKKNPWFAAELLPVLRREVRSRLVA